LAGEFTFWTCRLRLSRPRGNFDVRVIDLNRRSTVQGLL
jgi:hypothetical protein